MKASGGRDPFPTTRWTLIGRLHDPDIHVQQEALAELLTRYLPALRSYLEAVRRIPADRAADLLQDFLVSKVLEEQLMQRAQQAKGKFRSFLLASLDRFLISRHRQRRAQKRQPDQAGTLDGAEPVSGQPRPEEAFDLLWARELLAEAVRRMEAQCRQTARLDVWGVFEQRVLAAVSPDAAALSYEQLVAQFGLKSPAHASNVLITGKRMFARILRAVVAEYELDEAHVDAEIAELRAVLARHS